MGGGKVRQGWWLLSALASVIGTLFNSTHAVTTESVPSAVPKENTISAPSAQHLTEEQIITIVKKSFRLEDQASPRLSEMMGRYNSDMENVKVHLETLEQQKIANDALKKQIDQIQLELLRMKLDATQTTLRLNHQLKRCCRRSHIEIEGYVTKILYDLLGTPHEADIKQWLHSIFVAKQDLDSHLANVTQNLKSEFDVLMENNGKVLMDRVMKNLDEQIKKVSLGEVKIDSLSEEYIKKIVADALRVYDADKTGLVDYAMEPSGGQVISTRCTESYNARTSVLSIFGIPVWFPSHSARVAIAPGMSPGECWAFQNFPGFLVVKLAAPIQVEAFSLEHISKLLVAGGKIDSAPRAFSVYGLRNETDREPTKIGDYVYDISGESLQYFAAAVHGLVFQVVELQIHSNHGNPNYTCLYRFRVHGTLVAETV